MRKRFIRTVGGILLLAVPLYAQSTKKEAANAKARPSTSASDTKENDEKEPRYGAKTFAGLEIREIGPALTSGRIIDLAVDPRDARVWFVA